jgi:hypothetical protein
MADRFRAFDLMRECMGIISNTQPELIKTQQDQLFHGKDKDDKDLMSYASDIYADLKQRMNPLGVTDLKLTGSFYKEMFVDVGGDSFEINSMDDKADDLTAKYGNIWGLNTQGRTSYILETFRPQLRQRVEDKLKLLM